MVTTGSKMVVGMGRNSGVITADQRLLGHLGKPQDIGVLGLEGRRTVLTNAANINRGIVASDGPGNPQREMFVEEKPHLHERGAWRCWARSLRRRSTAGESGWRSCSELRRSASARRRTMYWSTADRLCR